MATLVIDDVEYTAEPLQGQFVFVDSSKNPVAQFSIIEENLWVLATGPYQPTNPHITITQEEGEVPTFYQGSVVCDQYREGTGYYGLFPCEVEPYTDMTIFGKINGVDVSGVVYAGICQFEEGLEIRSTGGGVFELFIPENAPATYSLDLKYY